MTRFVAIGECMVEMSPTDQPGHFRMGFAGDTMNTAWYLRRLLPETDSVDYMSAVGTDAISASMTDFLADAGIGTSCIARRTDRTVGLYMIQLQDGERSFSYWRGQSAARTLAQDAEALHRALSAADVAYFSGITMAILPPEDRSRLLAALSAFRTAGGEVVFDPNLRPRLWGSPDEMIAAISRAAAVSDTVLPSWEDEAAWFGDADLLATARRYADSGVRTVVVKNGPAPMLLWDKGETSHHLPAAVTAAVDTTAAGDSFNAGFLAGRAKGATLAQAIRAGAELAAKVIQSRGALVRT
ncbi:sugar kinase [Cereibacter sphaeroides]|uniref:sugar kinase n=1 Tax=Cereibacter sphaeroides TaxID=1063 RepID=UPI001F34F4ED|nr:sugar kinase [Cereibacter sphaeroides]MCE6967363.1 sugar kinase [Cereibacter sphaeroides]